MDYELVAVHTGSAHVTVDGAAREIRAGHVGLMLPGSLEHYTFARDRETRHSWVAVSPRQLPRETRRVLDEALPCVPLSAAMQTCMELARDTMAIDEPTEQPVLRAMAIAALTLYIAEAAHVQAIRVTEHPAMARARQTARRRAAEGIGVGDLAREAGVSTEHLVRLFRRHAGMTPGMLLREERLSHAIHLLAHTGLSVAEVARQSGFASPHHFARCVRAAVGMTPTELRARSWAPPADELAPAGT
jgi:AraC family transcriptional regulator of arabinose operon